MGGCQNYGPFLGPYYSRTSVGRLHEALIGARET